MRYVPRLADELIEQHVLQSHELWGDGRKVEERLVRLRGWLDREGQERFHMSGIVDAKGSLLASLKRYDLALRYRGELRRCVGIGAVFTEPAARGRGFAPTLLRTVLEESQSDLGCTLALLYSDIDPAYYARLGFRAAPAASWRIATARLPMPASGIEARKAGPDDLPRLLSIYHERTMGCPIRTQRTESSWRLFREINGVERDYLLVDDERAIGTMSTSRIPESPSGPACLFVEDWAVPPEAELAAWGAIREIALAESLTEVRGWKLPSQSAPLLFERIERERAIPMLAALEPGLVTTPEELAAAYFAPADHF